MADTYVYFVQPKSGGPIKIGRSRNPIQRVAALQSAHYEELRITRVVKADAYEERRLHRIFSADHIRGEWFSPTPALAHVANATPTGGPVSVRYANWDRDESAANGAREFPFESTFPSWDEVDEGIDIDLGHADIPRSSG